MTRPALSDAAVDSMLDSLPHIKGGAALLLFAGYELTSKQLIRIAERGDSLVKTKRERGGQTAEWKARALARIRELIATKKHDEAEAVQKAADEFKYKLKTLQRYWQLARTRKSNRRVVRPGCRPALKTIASP
jgi:hypothetical protein